MLKGEINVTNVKSLQLFFTSQRHFTPKYIWWDKNEIFFTFDTEYVPCALSGQEGDVEDDWRLTGKGSVKAGRF